MKSVIMVFSASIVLIISGCSSMNDGPRNLIAWQADPNHAISANQHGAQLDAGVQPVQGQHIRFRNALDVNPPTGVQPEQGQNGGLKNGINFVMKDTTPPEIIFGATPEYPPFALQSKIQGSVTLNFTVSASGSPKNVVVVDSTDHRFDQFAIDAIANWLFRPATAGGQPVDQRVKIQVNFRPEVEPSQPPQAVYSNGQLFLNPSNGNPSKK